MISKMGSYMTTDVGIHMTTDVGIHMTTNVGIDIYDDECVADFFQMSLLFPDILFFNSWVSIFVRTSCFSWIPRYPRFFQMSRFFRISFRISGYPRISHMSRGPQVSAKLKHWEKYCGVGSKSIWARERVACLSSRGPKS